MTAVPQREVSNDVGRGLQSTGAAETAAVDGRPVAVPDQLRAEVGHGAETWAALVALGPNYAWAAELRRMRDEDDAAFGPLS